MYRPNVEQLMIIISSVDEKASIKYSESTGKFYVSASIWVMEDYHYHLSTPHCSTVDEAIRAYYTRIQGKLIKLDNNKGACKLPVLIKIKEQKI